MKQKGRLPSLIWVLTAALILVFLVLQIVDSSENAFPSARSYMPSGTNAYATLLKRLGYNVEISRSARPELGPNDIAIVYNVFDESSLFQTQPRKAVEDKLKAYGFKKALVLYVNRDFDRSSKAAKNGTHISAGEVGSEIKLSIGKRYKFARPAGDFWSMDENDEVMSDTDDIALFIDRGYYDPFAVQNLGGGKNFIHVGDGLGSTNRFIDKERNAAFYAGILRFLGPENSKIVFIEDAIDNSEDSTVFGILAPWSGPGRLQAVLLVVLTIWMLGKRFGLPESRKYSQRGSKELVDAVADTSLRARATDFALAQIVEDCERQIRNALKIGSDVKRQDLLNLVPPEIGLPLARCIAGLVEKMPDGEAVKLVARLQAATDEFIGRYQRPARKRRTKM